jgi:hypothetical protein
MTHLDLPGLRRELARRAALTVTLHDWDPYILGESASLRARELPAGAVARSEERRWRAGRFPSVQLAIADAIFSKVRKYDAAVRSDVRPFAAAFGREPLATFARRDWREVFRATYGRDPDAATAPHHLSNEGRCATIVAAAAAMLASGVDSPAAARAMAEQPGGDAGMRRALGSAPGMGPALQAYTLMNLGVLTLKADRHVIRVVAPFLALPDGASPDAYEAALVRAQGELGISPFVVDQIVWYTEAASDDADGAAPTEKPLRATAPTPPVATPGVPPAAAQRTTARAPAHDAAVSGRRLIGTTIDIQPNAADPRLELRFAKADTDAFPADNKAPIRLRLNGTWWDGTIGRTATNPPYVHSNVTAGGSKRSVTELLRSLGVAERAELEFLCHGVGALELLRVVKPGAWRDGGNRGN